MDLLKEARSFQKSRVILTATELDLFTYLERHPSSAQNLARALGLDDRATTRVLDCLVTYGVLTKNDGRYELTDDSRPLSSSHPETIRPMLLHMSHMWRNWSQLTETVRIGANPLRERASEMGGDVQRSFIGAMHVIGARMSKEIARAYDASRFRRLLDIGGGSGSYTIAFLEQNPDLSAVLFDLPPVIEMAKARIEAAKLADRTTLVRGSFHEDELPTGCDLALLSAIIHQNSPEQNVALYRKIHRALEPGGVLLIRDHIMDEQRIHPPAGAAFALNMLVATDGGDTFTFSEVETTLREAGFDDVKLVREGPNMDCLVEAKRV
jgi:SAM-dependent methyltransferase